VNSYFKTDLLEMLIYYNSLKEEILVLKSLLSSGSVKKV